MLTKRFSTGSLSVLLLLVLVGCDTKNDSEKTTSTSPQTLSVQVINVEKKPTTTFTELPARVVSPRVAEVRPQVTGIIEKRLFEEGQLVQKGDVLYQIDPATYQSDVNSAKAALLKAQADESVSKKTALRYQNLIKRKLISQEDYDTAEGNWKQAQAQSAVAKAALDNAGILLSYTQVKAPITGRIDISNVTEGALTTTNQETPLTMIQALDPIYVDLTQSSLAMARIKKNLGNNSNLKVSVSLEDGSKYDHDGKLTFSGTRVDPSTGSVTLRAVIPNPNSILLPGMFVRAQIITANNQPMVTLPQSLVTFNNLGKATVMVVEDGKVAVRPVVTGGTVNSNEWVITSGLQEGDHVIANNLLRIRPGMPVEVLSDESVKKAPEAPASAKSTKAN
ncbi:MULTISPECIES: efflux RND transporter periplasmic adaptor subunit [Vibrio]|uniref:Efflux RND transporter periplasmic adaptor subunit n=2 Tax=Vibrio casei TaxID=673372 RepID=A0A368LM68_9VIBR|nr:MULTISPECIES: efflux RND transporter periplasmic adaptor subunit [Vibrio]RCS72895.1 efflux RND transporter periplasmic adaptor subunit [Vibrio casei]SJN38584.1 RND efflux system, membrane fusion protein CmeA [Vibrio casei]HBV75280.1 efflux RND transporter periplasmic adaptor subunit [Vibrio sp.]